MVKSNNQHKIRIYGDTAECHKCGKQWETNDPHPPECINERESRLKQIKSIKHKFFNKGE